MTEQDKVREVIRLKEQAPFAFDTQHAALVVVDMQRYFVRRNYPLAQVFEKLVPGVLEARNIFAGSCPFHLQLDWISRVG